MDTPTKTPVQYLTIDTHNDGQRIDNYLFSKLKQVPKSVLYRILRKGELRVNKKRIKAGYKLQLGDIVRVPPLYQEQTESAPVAPKRLQDEIENAILHEDERLICLNKPAGVAVHRGSGLAFGVIDILRQIRPYASGLHLVHRIDRETSGCLIIAKQRKVLLELQQLLQEGELEKHYLAIVHGVWPKKLRQVDAAIQRVTDSSGQHKMMVAADGKEALTLYEVVKYLPGSTLVKAKPITGRTHQIRVHCKSQHHPILGDGRYGERKLDIALSKKPTRMCLHAAEVKFLLPHSGQPYHFEAPLPEDMAKLT